MSSSLIYTFTKLRRRPSSVYRCAFRPACRFVRSASSSPTVLPSASTASFLSVYGLSGVGIRILVAMMKRALFECRAIVFQKPDTHLARRARRDRHDDVRKRRPRVVEVVPRGSRRMIRVRVIEPEQLSAELIRPLLREAIVRRPHQKAASRALLRRVRQRDCGGHVIAAANQRAAALVRICRFAVPPYLAGDGVGQSQIVLMHRRSRMPRSGIFQRRLERR